MISLDVLKIEMQAGKLNGRAAQYCSARRFRVFYQR